MWMPHPCFDRGSQSLAACQSRSLFLFPRCLSSFASLLPANKHAQWVSLAREASTAAMIVYSILSVRELVVRFAFNPLRSLQRQLCKIWCKQSSYSNCCDPFLALPENFPKLHPILSICNKYSQSPSPSEGH